MQQAQETTRVSKAKKMGRMIEKAKEKGKIKGSRHLSHKAQRMSERIVSPFACGRHEMAQQAGYTGSYGSVAAAN
jgi:hypothetical protein